MENVVRCDRGNALYTQLIKRAYNLSIIKINVRNHVVNPMYINVFDMLFPAFYLYTSFSLIQLHKLTPISRSLQKLDRVVTIDNGDACVCLFGNLIGIAPNDQTKVRQMTKQKCAK